MLFCPRQPVLPPPLFSLNADTFLSNVAPFPLLKLNEVRPQSELFVFPSSERRLFSFLSPKALFSPYMNFFHEGDFFKY